MSHGLNKAFLAVLCVSTLSLSFVAAEGTAQACNKKNCSADKKHHKKKCDCKECKGSCHDEGAAKKGDEHPEAAPAAPSKTE